MADSGSTADVFTLDGIGGGDGSPSVIDPATLAGGNGGDSGGDGFDPAIHIGRHKLNADGSFRRKRVRRGGGSAGPTAKVHKNIDPKGIEALLLSIHLAMSLRVPEMALEPAESAKLSEAIADVQSYYPVAVIDPKIVAWCNLGVAVVMIYGPRAYNIRERIVKESRKADKGGNGAALFGTVADLNSPFGETVINQH